jgi:cytochrome c biogenesis protein CcmG/thiol:disulfide interchange protein DsbE
MRLMMVFSVIALLIALAPATFAEESSDWSGPTFELESLGGDTLSEADVFTGGEVYLVDFWASWCLPCQRYLPQLTEMVETYGDRGLKVVIFCVDDAGSISTAKAMLEGEDYPFTILFDPEADVQSQLGVRRIPTTVIFDPSGEELWRHVGYEDGVEEIVAAEVDSLLPAAEEE